MREGKVDTSPHVTATAEPRLRFSQLSKAFDATVALDNVSFDVNAGEVHALLGANGAGKSTLIKILAGLYAPDSGSVLMDGASEAHAVSFIHQDLGLVETMTVAESVAVTRGFPRRAGLIDWATTRRMAQQALSVVGASISVDAQISELSRADRSIVAIARAITDDCTVLVLDEPTASLPDDDVRRLLKIVLGLRVRGVSILYVTHRLDEVFEIADRVTVLRDGRLVHSSTIDELSPARLVELIVGSAPAKARKTLACADAAEVIKISHVGLRPDRPRIPEIRVVSGEILGLAGLRGSGQEELGRGLAGVAALDCTSVEVDGHRIRRGHRNVARSLRRVVGFASGRREQEGLAMTMTIRENLFMNPAAAGQRLVSWLSPGGERVRARRIGTSLKLRPNSPDVVVGTLSGGNQQRIVLGRWLATRVRVLVLEEPTSGVDVGARAEIYRLIGEVAERGLSVVVVSSDFDELALICHRVLVFDRGAISQELDGPDVTIDNITHHSAGGTESTGGKRC
jgi:ribose transport system ATP-binding protein